MTTDRANLRDRIAEALISWTYRGKDPEHGGILATVRANAYSRADAVLAVLPEPADRAAVLSTTERDMLRYALDLAQEQMFSRGDEFTEDDQAAVDRLRRMAGETPATTEAHTCGNCEGVDPDTCLTNPNRPAAGARQDGSQP